MLSAVRLFGIIFALQVVVLLATALLFNAYGGSLEHEIGGQDAREYMLLGEHLLLDGNLQLPDKTAFETWRTPGYPAFVAAVFALTNSSLAALLVILALVGAAISGLMYLTGRELGLSHRYSFLAALLFGISPAVIWIPPSGMGGDTTFLLLCMLALYALLRIEKSPHWWLVALGIGIALGAATLIRPLGYYFGLILILAIPFFISSPLISKKNIKLVLLALFGFFLIITPWMARNHAVAHHFSISSQFAFNPFYYNIPIFLASKNNTGEEAERIKLMDQVGTRDVYALVNGFTYYDELAAIDKQFLKENFFSYTLFHLYKTIPFFVGSGVNVIYATITNEIPNMPDVPFFPRATENTASLFYGGNFGAVFGNLLYYWPATLERLVWVALFLLAFTAPFVTEGRERRFALLGLVMIFTIALLASPIAQPRYRIPAEPFIWLLATLTLSTLIERIRRKTVPPSEQRL